ncbi:hypothetical protein SCB71_15460 [Herbiconiux sp. KACC 21604]|uniref:hypothetical protein n=1 Tax=unclassified Herbiconiux TaxID=2618217 RepID=UPI00149213FF|nr:hypothetical protein [Herbiconiux sp. SALV-R1]QJU54524.1 hypothetical protein HL652_13405 [Herbiconiux sp. SALV-R1]WPO85607.1 hypothetical protein SCB71_15460 [Herbiconiux sp. KACC 21604]
MRSFNLIRSVDSNVFTVLESVEGDLRMTPYLVREPSGAGLFFLGHATDQDADMELSLLGNSNTPEGAVERLEEYLQAHDV